jgi:hypothetical protein
VFLLPHRQGVARGTLNVDDNGLVFHPHNNSYPALVIHWDNLVSTYPDVQPYPAKWIHLGWILIGYGAIASTFTLGVVYPWVGVVSVKFKDATFDKVCVVQFCFDNFVSFLARRWAVNLEKLIWELKRSHRSERQTD